MLGELCALGTAFCWGLASSLYLIGMKDTSPFLANTIKTFTGGVFSLLVAFLWEDLGSLLPLDWVQVGFLVLITFLSLGIGDWLYFKSLKIAEISLVAGIANMYPLWVAFFTILVGTEELTLLTLLAALTIIGGVLVIIVTSRNAGPTQRARPSSVHIPETTVKQYLEASGFAVLSAFTWGLGIFGLGFSLEYFSPLSANAIRMVLIGGILLLPFLIFPPAKKRTKWPSQSSLMLLGLTSVVVIGIGGWLMLVAIELLGAARSSALLGSSPFFAALIAIVVFKEKPTLFRLIGILFVCLGIVLISIS